MCNPRKVMVRLAENVRGAFRQGVEQSAGRSGSQTEVARMDIDLRLDDTLGDEVLITLERVLDGDYPGLPAWTRDENGRFRREAAGVTLIYDPAAQRMTAETAVTEIIDVEARGMAEAAGVAVGEVVAEAAAHYYDDGFGGRTEATADQEARDAAKKELDRSIEELRRAQNPEAFAAADAAARRQAEARAEAELAERREAVRDRLRTVLADRLRETEATVQRIVNRAVGEAYRQTLIRLVKDNGGKVLKDQQDGASITLELEV